VAVDELLPRLARHPHQVRIPIAERGRVELAPIGGVESEAALVATDGTALVEIRANPGELGREGPSQLRFVHIDVRGRCHLVVRESSEVERVQPREAQRIGHPELSQDRVPATARRQPVERVQAHVEPERPAFEPLGVAARERVVLEHEHPPVRTGQ
jgi:hypothetical protein